MWMNARCCPTWPLGLMQSDNDPSLLWSLEHGFGSTCRTFPGWKGERNLPVTRLWLTPSQDASPTSTEGGIVDPRGEIVEPPPRSCSR